MSWPWVSRKRYEAVHANWVVSDEAHKAARAAGEECAHRLAACDQERKDAKASFATLANLCRQLETKLRDCEDPPITRKELEKLTKLIAVLRSENEGLKKHVTRSDDTIARLTKRLDSDGDEASA